jgi:hypothetical protein
MREYITIGVQITPRQFLKLLLLYYAIYTWYYSFLATLDRLQAQYPMQLPPLLVFFSLSITTMLLVRGGIGCRLPIAAYLYAWAGLSPFITIGFAVTTDPTLITGLTMVAGGLFGTAVWTYSLYFADLTVITERGRVGSLVTAFTLFTAPIALALSTQYTIPVQLFLSLIIFLVLAIKSPRPLPVPFQSGHQPAAQFHHLRRFLLFLVPWLLLSLNNATLIRTISTQLNVQFLALRRTASILEYLSAGLGTMFGGLVVDWISRRTMALISYTMLGITACIAGLIPTPSLYLLFHLVSGFSWGSLLVLFLLIVWSEILPPRISGLTYGLGLSAYQITQGISGLTTPLPLSISEAALINAILMFLSIFLLYGAPKLIPDEVRERMYYDLYLYQAKKLVT